MAPHSYAVARPPGAEEEELRQSREIQGSQMRANKRIKFAHCACPTRKSEALLLAAHTRRSGLKMDSCQRCAPWSSPRGFQRPRDYAATSIALAAAVASDSLTLATSHGFERNAPPRRHGQRTASTRNFAARVVDACSSTR